MLLEPNRELLTWTGWVQNLLSFLVGIAVSYFTITVQNRSGDRNAQKRMRQIIYRELAESIVWTEEVIAAMPAARIDRDSKQEFIDPPSMHVHNSPYTFEGEEYMRENHDVSYSLPEMAVLKRMYVLFRRMSEMNQIVSIGEFKSALTFFGREFTRRRIIRTSFKKFAKPEFASLRAIANYYSTYRIKPEEIMRFVTGRRKGESKA